MGSIVCLNCGVTIYITKTNAKKKKYPTRCSSCHKNPLKNERKGYKEKVTEPVEEKQFKGDGVEVKKDYGAAFRKK